MGKVQAALTVGSTASFSCDVCNILPSSTVNGSAFLELCGNPLC